MIGIKVNVMDAIEETSGIETDHMTELEVGIEMIEEDLVGIEETGYPGVEVDLPTGIKVKGEGVITVGN